MDGLFFTHSNGQCFVCLNSPSSSSKLKLAHHSIQNLTQFLKVDWKSSEIPLKLLKVELCQECFSLKETCVKLFRELEIIQMKLEHYFGNFQSKLSKSVKNDYKMMGKIGEPPEMLRKLRNKTLDKCKRKLSKILVPKLEVKIEKLGERQNTGFTNSNYISEMPEISEIIEVKPADLTYFDEEEIIEANYDNDNDDPLNFKQEEPVEFEGQGQPKKMVKSCPKRHKVVPNKSKFSSIPLPIKYARRLISNPAEFRENCERDKKTGTAKCRLCSRIFKRYSNYCGHYNKIHLQVKFNCPVCNFEFSAKGNYNRHFMTVHMGLKYSRSGKRKLSKNPEVNVEKVAERQIIGVTTSNDIIHEMPEISEIIEVKPADLNYFNEEEIDEAIDDNDNDDPLNIDPHIEQDEPQRFSEIVKQPIQEVTPSISTNQEHVVNFNLEDAVDFEGQSEPKKVVKSCPIKRYTKIVPRTKNKTKFGSILPPIQHGGNTSLNLPKCRENCEIDKKTGRAKCRLCSRIFPRYTNYCDHYNKIHLQLKYNCPVCNFEFSMRCNYNRHFKSLHLKSEYACDLCPNKYTDIGNLARHKNSVHFGYRYKCKFCPKSFLYSTHRNDHLKKVHQN